MKTFILLAGLPASGKDTVAEILEKNNFYLMTYSKEILKPIIINPKINLEKFTKETLNVIKKEELVKIIEHIENLKIKETGRELYISVAQYLNKIVKKYSNEKFKHFTLFATTLYKDKTKIAIAGFRQKPEIDILKILYPNAIIKTIFVDCENKIRYQRLQQRDNLSIDVIKENEKYEIQTTHNKMIKEIKFDYIIKNNSTLENLENETEKIIHSNFQ